MDVERIRVLSEAYGADRRRWPTAERAVAEGWTPQERVAFERLMSDAADLDAALDAAPRPQVSPALRDRVIAQALAAGLTPRKARALWERLVFWFGATWAAAACAGVIAGVGLTSHLTANAQADAVLAQSAFAPVDDTEVLQ